MAQLDQIAPALVGNAESEDGVVDIQRARAIDLGCGWERRPVSIVHCGAIYRGLILNEAVVGSCGRLEFIP